MLEIWYYHSPKKTNIIFSRKNALEGDLSGIIEKDDIPPRKYDISVEVPYWMTSYNEILESVAMILWVFIYCFPVKKTPGNLIYKIETWLLLQFLWLAIFYNEESSILCTIHPSVFRGVLERQLRKLFAHLEMVYNSKSIRTAVKFF